jgi:hypothetical protein
MALDAAGDSGCKQDVAKHSGGSVPGVIHGNLPVRTGPSAMAPPAVRKAASSVRRATARDVQRSQSLAILPLRFRWRHGRRRKARTQRFRLRRDHRTDISTMGRGEGRKLCHPNDLSRVPRARLVLSLALRRPSVLRPIRMALAQTRMHRQPAGTPSGRGRVSIGPLPAG